MYVRSFRTFSFTFCHLEDTLIQSHLVSAFNYCISSHAITNCMNHILITYPTVNHICIYNLFFQVSYLCSVINHVFLCLCNVVADPLIYTVPRGSLKPGHNNLTCLVTGTYPSSSPIEMNLFRNNVNLTEMEGVRSSGVRPNEDNTYQLRKTVMINASESEVYQCVVNHKSFPGTRKNTWGKMLFSIHCLEMTSKHGHYDVYEQFKWSRRSELVNVG